jgi:ABC-2 type transport system permease protein
MNRVAFGAPPSLFGEIMNSRLVSIIRKEFIQLFRDKRMLALILVLPLVQLFLLGYASNTDLRDVPMVVFDQSHSPAARALLDAYRATDYFKVAYFVGSDAELRDLIETGKAALGLVIPPDYAAQLQKGQAQVALVVDGSDAAKATTALSVSQLIAQNHATQILSARLARSGLDLKLQPPLELRTTVWYNPDMISAYFMIPGVIGMILYAITAILTATSVVRERERGTIEQLIVTPIRPWELVVGKIVPFVIMGLFDAGEVIAVGHWWFGVPVRGSLLLIGLVSTLFLFSGLGIGLFMSTIANTQQEAMLTVFMTLLPAIWLAGFLFPLDNMPPILQAVSYVIPLRYFMTIIRVLLLKGVGLESIQGDVLALLIFAVVIMGAAALRFRKRLD